ncbi:MAG: tetratricopeptide repeat protein [Verrucomicrobia bacterium]|nr:tetratricopeptide repeat protein [Verrucomicrobiota bacterium]
MRFASSIVVLAAIVMVTFHYWQRLAEEVGSPHRRWLIAWTVKGVGVPLFVWIIFNSGIVPGVPSLMTEIELARARGGFWLPAFLRVMAPTVLVIGTYWAAVSFGWMVADIASNVTGENRGEFIGLISLGSFVLVPVAALVLYSNGWAAAGLAVLIWLFPLAHFTVPLVVTKKLPPMYSRAIAKMKFGKYKEAEMEVIKELEECEDDFEGWMMIAGLYATHFHDMTTAGQVIQELCEQPNLTGSQVSVALHRLADWQLKVGGDPTAARRALEEIHRRFPGSHVDKMARLRINQLPASRDELRERQQGKPIHLPALVDISDEAGGRHSTEISKEEAAARANQYVEKLKQNPDNVPAREELARIWAEQLGRVDLAVEQLELLSAMPDQPARKLAEWLSLMAAWQIRYRPGSDTGRKLLERVIREFPQSPQAFAAQRRLNLMDVEQKFRKTRTAAINPADATDVAPRSA